MQKYSLFFLIGLTGCFGPKQVENPTPIQQQVTEEVEAVVESSNETDFLQKEVESLKTKLAETERQLQEFGTALEEETKNRRDAQKKWEALKKEAEILKESLEQTKQERDQLKTDLQATIVKLDEQTLLTAKFKTESIKFKAEATENLWQTFRAQSKTYGCTWGTKWRLNRCHTAFDEALDSKMRDKFAKCVNADKLAPTLNRVDSEESLPKNAEIVGTDSRHTNKWYIQFCDIKEIEKKEKKEASVTEEATKEETTEEGEQTEGTEQEVGTEETATDENSATEEGAEEAEKTEEVGGSEGAEETEQEDSE